MASQAAGQDISIVRRRRRRAPAGPFARVVHEFQSLNASHRRLIIAGVGGLFSLGLGVVAASAVRLPAEIRDGYAAPDQPTVRDELPSVTAARAFATNNPPPYVVAQANDVATAPRSDLYADQPVAQDDDRADSATAATPTGPSPSADDEAATAERQHDAAAASPAGTVQN